MKTKAWKLLTILVLLSFTVSGCYYFSAKKEINNAKQLVSDLKGKGGPTLVPYEYTSAETFLEISEIEFNDGDYSHAKRFAERSKSASNAGLSEIGKKK
jgi:hypothetical protein